MIFYFILSFIVLSDALCKFTFPSLICVIFICYVPQPTLVFSHLYFNSCVWYLYFEKYMVIHHCSSVHIYQIYGVIKYILICLFIMCVFSQVYTIVHLTLTHIHLQIFILFYIALRDFYTFTCILDFNFLK